MRVGVNTHFSNLASVVQCGFDFIELSLNTFSLLEENEFQHIKKELYASPIKSESCNLFYPADFRLTGPDIDRAAIKEYNKLALDRASQLGAATVIVGCGPQRKYPEGWTKEEAVKQFGESLADIGDKAGAYNMMVTIEPIRSSSTNILNTVIEGYELVQQLNHPRVQLMADFAQMRKQGESMADLTRTADTVKHIHISDSHTRKCPLERSEDLYEELFSALQKVGYKGPIVIEASGYNLEDGLKSVPFLRMLGAEYYIG